MILYVVRHAWAEPFGEDWPEDHVRPLTEEGRKRFAALVKLMVQRGFAPELIATSPLVRCRQTAELVVKGSPAKKPRLVPRDELQPGSDLEGILNWTAQEAAGLREVAWVGHNPDVEQMAALLIGDPHTHLRFAKGAIAAIEFPGPPKVREGKLRWLVTAKVLGL